MRTIHNYIARLYLVNVLALLILLFGFVVSIDVVTNLGDFANAASERLTPEDGDEVSGVRSVLATVVAIIDIWGPRLLQLFNYLNGVVLVAAMGFTCAQLVKHREFVALLASGISLFRVARPFLLVALFFSGIQLVNQEVVLPRVAPLLVRDAGDAGERDVERFRVALAPDRDGRLFSARLFEPNAVGEDGIELGAYMQDVVVYERDEQGTVETVITANGAVWDGGGWALRNGLASVDPASPAFAGETQVPIERISSTLSPAQLKVRHFQGFAANLGFFQLTHMLHSGSTDRRAEKQLDRIRWGRFAAILSNIFTLIAALPFFLVRLPRPMLGSALKAAPVGLAGLTAAAASTSMSLEGLPVWLGVFIPPLLLLPLAIFFFTSIRT
ncbi:MAG: LptF/LptG family permease [Planctomycetota bacterium]